jgi:hypothetical protein
MDKVKIMSQGEDSGTFAIWRNAKGQELRITYKVDKELTLEIHYPGSDTPSVFFDLEESAFSIGHDLVNAGAWFRDGCMR